SADSGEVCVVLPVGHLLKNGRVGRIRLLRQPFVPGLEVGSQPIQGLPAETGAFLLVGRWAVLALCAAGPGGGAGGPVPVAGAQVAGQGWPRGERFRVPPGGRGRELLIAQAHVGQEEAATRTASPPANRCPCDDRSARAWPAPARDSCTAASPPGRRSA